MGGAVRVDFGADPGLLYFIFFNVSYVRGLFLYSCVDFLMENIKQGDGYLWVCNSGADLNKSMRLLGFGGCMHWFRVENIQISNV